MRPWRSTGPRRGVLTTAAFTVVVAALIVAGVPAQAANTAAGNDAGFAQLASCLTTADRVEALYVMDVSGSLNSTDPSGQRFDALEASVSQLSALVDSAPGNLRVDAALATFGDDYTPPAQVKNWVQVPPGGADTVAADFRTAAETSWQDNRGAAHGTNYQAALDGAHASLVERGSDLGTCRVMFWFTDGLFDLSDPGRTDAASARLCEPDGVVDQLRRDQVSVIALALFNQAVQDDLTDPAKKGRRGELEAIATGASAQKTCGTMPMAEGDRAGVYLPVTSAGALASIFSGAIAQSRGGVPVTAASAHPVTVTVEPGVRSFQTDITTTAHAGHLHLVTPDGTEVDVPADGTATPVGDATATARSYDTLATVTVDMPGSGTAGTWQVDAGPARAATTYLFSGLTLHTDAEAATLVAGSPGTVAVTARDRDGNPADLSVYATTDVAASVRTADGTTIPATVDVTSADTGDLTVSFSPPANTAVVSTDVHLTPTLASGMRLPPVATAARVSVALPAAFPTIDPSDHVQVGTLTGTQPGQATITAHGSPDGPTSVCIAAPTDVQAPQLAGQVTISPADCVNLAANQTQTIDVRVATEHSADGTGSAILPITLNAAPDASGTSASASVTVPVTWDMVRPVDQGRRILLVAALMLAAVALPLAALWATNRALARFERGNLQTGTNPVVLGPAGPVRADGGPLYRPDQMRWHYIDPSSARRFTAASAPMVTLVASAPLNPFGGPTFRAVAAPGWQVVGADQGAYAHAGQWTPVTPGLGAVYLLAAHDADVLATGPDDPIPATVILITTSSSPADLGILVARAAERFDWEQVATAIRRTAADHAAAATPSARTAETADLAPADAPGGAGDFSTDPFAGPTTSRPTPRPAGGPPPSPPPASGPASGAFDDPFA